MTTSNHSTDPTDDTAAHDTNADSNASAVSSLADTTPNEPSEHLQSDSGRQIKCPAWLIEVAHQLRHIGQWRLIIKPDQTIDLDYLAKLALQAKRKARPQTAPPQLSLFPLDPVATNSEAANQITLDTTPMTSMLALNHTPNADSSLGRLPSFTIIHGNNQPIRPNTIILPDDILTIEPDEELHAYLSRVAAAAMGAAISTCGSKEAAFIRLGSKAPQDRSAIALPLPANRPALVLAPAHEQT
jgi:hypothetical protein